MKTFIEIAMESEIDVKGVRTRKELKERFLKSFTKLSKKTG